VSSQKWIEDIDEDNAPIFAENPRSHAAGSVSGSRDEDLMECDVPRQKGL
jgi:hypothetical protein